MGNGRRAALVALAISVVALVASTALTAARIVTPSSGSGTVPRTPSCPRASPSHASRTSRRRSETGMSSSRWTGGRPPRGPTVARRRPEVPEASATSFRSRSAATASPLALDVPLVPYPSMPMLRRRVGDAHVRRGDVRPGGLRLLAAAVRPRCRGAAARGRRARREHGPVPARHRPARCRDRTGSSPGRSSARARSTCSCGPG